jgi:hypothetical protein
VLCDCSELVPSFSFVTIPSAFSVIHFYTHHPGHYHFAPSDNMLLHTFMLFLVLCGGLDAVTVHALPVPGHVLPLIPRANVSDPGACASNIFITTPVRVLFLDVTGRDN